MKTVFFDDIFLKISFLLTKKWCRWRVLNKSSIKGWLGPGKQWVKQPGYFLWHLLRVQHNNSVPFSSFPKQTFPSLFAGFQPLNFFLFPLKTPMKPDHYNEIFLKINWRCRILNKSSINGWLGPGKLMGKAAKLLFMTFA
jgi:hypothetical protein